MSQRLVSSVSLLILLVFAGTMLASCGTSSSSTTGSGGSTSDGQTLMQTRCSVCHSLSRVTSSQKTADQWKTTVDRMIGYGAQLSTSEEVTLIAYLAQNYK